MKQGDTLSIYYNAPDLLLDKIAEVNAILGKIPNKKDKPYEFWHSVMDTMHYSYNYMMDLQFIMKRNTLLEAENAWLKSWAKNLHDRLEPYEIIRSEIAKGTLDETLKVVKHEK